MPTIQRRVKLALISGVLFAGIIVSMLVFTPERATNPPPPEITPTTTEKTTEVSQDTYSYSGRTGVDALILLEEQATIEKAASGLVTSINGRKAEDAKREYWSFYVNDEAAQVGPADYQTSDTDQIEWKIETY